MKYKIPHQRNILNIIVKNYNPDKVVLFGSRAKGEQTTSTPTLI